MFPSYRLTYFIFACVNSIFKKCVNRQKMIFFWKSKATDVCVNYLEKVLLEAKSDVLLLIPVYHGHDLWMEFSILQSAKAIPMIFHTSF